MRRDELRVIAIGDVHGQDRLLAALLLQIETSFLDKWTAVVFMGDYLNRSQSPEECRGALNRIQDFVSRYPAQTFLLRGNHEWNFLQTLDFEADHLQVTQPWELEIYRDFEKLLRSTLPFYETDQYYFSHAGGVMKNGNLTRREESEDQRFALYWRYDLPDRAYEKTIVRAHKIVPPEEVFGKHVISVDLGAYKTGKLGAVVLPDNILIISE